MILDRGNRVARDFVIMSQLLYHLNEHQIIALSLSILLFLAEETGVISKPEARSQVVRASNAPAQKQLFSKQPQGSD